jgi:hypothetical protein
MDRPEAPGDESEAVIAHGLLNSMSVVVSGVTTLRDRWSGLSPTARDDLFERVLKHAVFVTDVLKDVTRGLPSSTRAELERLRAGKDSDT